LYLYNLRCSDFTIQVIHIKLYNKIIFLKIGKKSAKCKYLLKKNSYQLKSDATFNFRTIKPMYGIYLCIFA